jgi:dolichyl-phosphate beta-glucosyltransferase
MTAGHSPFVSVVVPTLNEAERIGATLRRIVEHFRATHQAYEIIVVDDGSTDNTIGIAQHAMADEVNIRILRNVVNHGKGHAVRRGMMEATGTFIVFSDADLSTPIEEFDRLVQYFSTGADIVIGSRRRPDSRLAVRQPWYRETLLGGLLRMLVRTLLVPDIADSQCGFKCFRRDVAKRLFALQRMERFSFDVEILYLAAKFGYKVAEVGVRWVNDPRTRVNLLRDPLRIFLDLLRIRLNDWRGAYDEAHVEVLKIH